MSDLQTDLQNVILLINDILERKELTEDHRWEIEAAKASLEEVEETL